MVKTGFLQFLLMFSLLLDGISPVFAQVTPPKIINPGTGIISYCGDSILIAPEIIIENVVINDATEGIKISILNYRKGEDTLGYIKTDYLDYSWNTNGSLEITGIGTAEDYQQAVRNIYYKNLTASPDTGSRVFSVGLLDIDYFPANKHFYRFIRNRNISWKEAKATADTMKYYGLQGYLATVTSAEENDFIWTKTDGIGWIGASDEAVDGEWRWVTGPEAGQQFWQGDASGYPVNNRFSDWAEGEPNNAFGGQEFAHYNQHPDKAPKSWNDMKNDGSGSAPQYYTPQGFVIEYGGMPGDPEVNLSAAMELKIHPVPTVGFDIGANVCIDEIAELNYSGSATNRDTYYWNLNEFAPGEILSNPGNTRGPLIFRRNSGLPVNVGIHVVSEFGCESEYLSTTLYPKPLYNIQLDKTEGCPPLNIYFLAESDANDSILFTWYFGDGNSRNGSKVSNSYDEPATSFDVQVHIESKLTGCTDTLLMKEKVKTYPAPKALFESSPEEVFITNPVVTFRNNSENAVAFEWDFGDFFGTSKDENPVHRYQTMGSFDIHLTAYNNYGCEDVESGIVTVGFEKVFPPTVFSPNAKLWEDQEFRIYAEGMATDGYELIIYNRWGEKIFTSQSQEKGWNGRMKNGNFAPAGVYTWVIQFNDFAGKSHKQQGNVTLLF